MNKGLQLLLLSMGLKVEPAEIEAAWERSKDALPQLAKAFDELNAGLIRVEEKLDKILSTPAHPGLAINEQALATALLPVTSLKD
jgi:hypothetical protein